MRDLVSVIVPVYNVYEWLEECVESIMNQSYSNLEIILVDDGSDDGSGHLCDKLSEKDDRIVVIHQENHGASAARNRGILAANGEWIGFVDADDLIHTDMYKNLIENVDRYSDNIIQVGIGSFTESESPKLEKKILRPVIEQISSIEYLKMLLLHIGDSSVYSKLFSKKFFENNLFNETISNEDFELLIRMVHENKNFKLTTVNCDMYFYRKRLGSTTNQGYSKAIIDCVYNADYAYQIVEKDYPDLKKIAERFCIIQNEQFLRYIPLQKMNKGNKHYNKVIKYIRKNYWKAMVNPYVSLHVKRNISAFFVCPVLAKKVYEVVLSHTKE